MSAYGEVKTKETVYHIARTREELEQAFSLVYSEYAKKGYITSHYKSGLRLSFFNALPSTATFIAKQDNLVVATATLIPDTPLGIPMDKIYKEEVDRLRKEGRRVAEVSQLATDGSLFPPGWFSMFNFNKLIFVFHLFKIILDYAVYVEHLNELCIAVNPKQKCLYNFLAFEELGGLKYYSSVNKAPAIAKHINLDNAEERARQRRGIYKIFFQEKTPPEVFADKFILTPDDLEYFFTVKSDIFIKAAKGDLGYITALYGAEITPLLDKIDEQRREARLTPSA